MKLKRQLSFYFAVFALLWITLLYQNCAPPQTQDRTLTDLGNGANPDDTRYVRALGGMLSDGYDMESTCGVFENYVCESLHQGPDLPSLSDVVRECFSIEGEQICLQVLETSKSNMHPTSSYKCSVATVEVEGRFPFQGQGESLEEAFKQTNDRCVATFLSL